MSDEPVPGVRVDTPREVALCAQEAPLSDGGQALGEDRGWLTARLRVLGCVHAETPGLLLLVSRDGDVAAVVLPAQGA